MLTFIKYLIYLLVAAVLVAFSVPNHEFVKISLDPLSTLDAAAFSFQAPMYVIIFVSVAVGVFVGGVSVWFGQGRYRRSTRKFRSETNKLKADLQVYAAETKVPAKLARRA